MLHCEPDCFNTFDGLLCQLQKSGHIENKIQMAGQAVCLHKHELSLFDVQNKQTQKHNNMDTVKASCYIKDVKKKKMAEREDINNTLKLKH